MELHRVSSILVVLGNIVAALALPAINNQTSLNLDCTNDFEKFMFCQFEAQNCAEYNLTVLANEHQQGEEHCIFHNCGIRLCCCSVQMLLIYGETHTATVWREGQSLQSTDISVIGTVKPKAPTLISVTESNGNFLLRWISTTERSDLNEILTKTANVTYYKKGDTEKVSERVQPWTIDGVIFYELAGKNLEPRTTYVVSVKSYIAWSEKFSDSSNEQEFTTGFSTDISPDTLALAITISLSVLAVVITATIYICYVKMKTKLWDTFANPKLFISPSHHEVLKPDLPVMSSVCVEPLIPDDNKWSKGLLMDVSSASTLQSSGISTGSSCLSYANAEPHDVAAGVQNALSKIFANISPMSPLTNNLLSQPNQDSALLSGPLNSCENRVDDTSCGSLGIDNKTYSILIPSCQQQIMTEKSEVQTQAELVCDSAYQPVQGNSVTCAGEQVPLGNSSLLTTDMSYQQCNAGSAYAADTSLSSISSGINTIASYDLASRPEAGWESSDEMSSVATKLNNKSEELAVCDKNPCYGCLPADSPMCLFVDDSYQPFQSLRRDPGVSFPDRVGEKEEHVDKHPEDPFSKISPVIPGFINTVPGSQCLFKAQTTQLFSLISAHQSAPIITDSGYKCV